MLINIPYEIGDKITVNGEKKTIKGLHIYLNREEKISNIRAHIGKAKYITIESEVMPNDKL